jgi:predicted amidohydrolase
VGVGDFSKISNPHEKILKKILIILPSLLIHNHKEFFMRSLHVAVAQVHSVSGDPGANLARMERQIASAAAVGVDVILFAETVVHSYEFSEENKAFAEPVGGPLTTQIAQWARQYGITVLAGFIEKDGDNLHNSHVVAQPDGTLAAQRKHNMTPIELKGGLSAGPRERTVFEFNGVRTAIIICADSGMDGLYDMLEELRIEFRFHPCAGGDHIHDKPIPYLRHEELFTEEGQALAAEYRNYVCLHDAFVKEGRRPLAFAAANALGFDGKKMHHMGHCLIADTFGTLRAQIPGTLIIEHQQDQMVHSVIHFPDAE